MGGRRRGHTKGKGGWWCMRRHHEEEEVRSVRVGAPLDGPERPYTSNYITTSKYTVWSFLFINLFEQFRRLANFYFLIISILQLIPGLSPTGRFTTLLPLCIVIAVTGAKEAYEDVVCSGPQHHNTTATSQHHRHLSHCS